MAPKMRLLDRDDEESGLAEEVESESRGNLSAGGSWGGGVDASTLEGLKRDGLTAPLAICGFVGVTVFLSS